MINSYIGVFANFAESIGAVGYFIMAAVFAIVSSAAVLAYMRWRGESAAGEFLVIPCIALSALWLFVVAALPMMLVVVLVAIIVSWTVDALVGKLYSTVDKAKKNHKQRQRAKRKQERREKYEARQ